MQSPLLTVQEVAQYLNLKPSKIRMMVFHREIPFLKVGRLVRFHRQAIDTWILALSAEGQPVLRHPQLFDSSILNNGSPNKRRTL